MTREEITRLTVEEHTKAGSLESDVNYDVYLTEEGAVEYRRWFTDTERGFECDRSRLVAVVRPASHLPGSGRFVWSPSRGT